MSKITEKQIGVVGVDSGTLLLGDPCYWLSDKDYEKEVLNPHFDRSRQICYDLGHKGKASWCQADMETAVILLSQSFKMAE